MMGKNIAKRRKELKLSQSGLAKLVGVSQGAIWNWENDVSNPVIESIPALLEALQTDANYLFGTVIPEDNPDIAPYKAGHEEPPPPNAEHMFDKAKKILPDENSSRSEAFEDLDKLSEYDLLLLKKIVKAMAEVRAECMTENPHGNK